MDKQITEPSEDRYFYIEKQEVTIQDIETSGYIPDIGWGEED